LGRSGTTENLYRYTGEQMDDLLGMQYLRARYARIKVGKFASADFFEGYKDVPLTLNPYTYVEGNPANRIDPSGQFSISDFMVTLGIRSKTQQRQVRGFYHSIKSICRTVKKVGDRAH